MQKTLEKRIILFAFLILFLTITVNSGMDIVGFRRDYIQALIVSSQNLGISLKGGVEKVLGLGLDIKDVEGLTEKCREIAGANPEIAYCVITDSGGRVLFINDEAYRTLRFDIIRETLQARQVQSVYLIGENELYYDAVTSIRNPEGKQVAQVHVGFPSSLVATKVSGMILRSLIVLIVSFLLSFSLVVVFAKRSIMQPISLLLKGVRKIAEGDFTSHIKELPVYEFNQLAADINNMSDALRNRDAEIRRNYKELESVHQDLHSSYLKLERLSLELEKSEELYKSLMEDASDAIIVIGDDENVRMVNKMAEDFFGCKASELLGLSISRMLLLLNAENAPLVYSFFKKVLAGEHSAEEILFTRKDGENVVGRIHANCATVGEEKLMQAIIRDVTREREILLNLEKSASDLARLNRMKNSFLGLASHELKTPLTVIIGYSELILSDMSDKTDKTVLEMVENIANASSRLDSIVKDMVDVSLIDDKRLQLKIDELDVNRLVESSLSELRFFFSMRKQAIVTALDESIPTIKGDSVRLMQLLSNVLGNAIKFTPDGGKVTVSTRSKYLLRSKQPVTIDAAEPLVAIGKDRHLYVEITVADTGIGIDLEDQLHIFDKFYEVGNIDEHSSGKVAFKSRGAGLGLSIAKGIVEMHGGEIWVESPGYNPEKLPGSVFHILLPLNPVTGDGTIDYLNLVK